MISQRLLRLAVSSSARRYQSGLSDLEAIQRGMLSRLLKRVAASPVGNSRGIDPDWSWETFSERHPVTEYGDWQKWVEADRAQGFPPLIQSPTVRFQPTSGSTSAMKWIPYSQCFLNELDAAIGPWLHTLYHDHPALLRGRHYWSMSWVPTSLRSTHRNDLNDDLKLMSFGKRWLAGRTQSVPTSVSLADTSDDSLFATLACLAADRRLSLLSVWSPTFGMRLLEALSQWRDELAWVLASGDWGRRRRAVAGLRCPRSLDAAGMLMDWDGQLNSAFFESFWPSLALVSAWDTAASQPWARRLHDLLPHAAFQGKGLWATEGVVTIPYGGHYPLAYRSHVYEFQDPDNGQVFAPWQLRAGQRVIPLLSTGSGLLRYRLNDLIEVTGHLQDVPCFRFLGRRGTVDLVGEKLTDEVVAEALYQAPVPDNVTAVGALACSDSGAGKPGYVVLLEGPEEAAVKDLACYLDDRLAGHFHYRLARDLYQLEPLRCVARPDMRERYLHLHRERGMIEGNIKVETLRALMGPCPDWLKGEPTQDVMAPRLQQCTV